MSKQANNPDEHLVDILEPPEYLPGGRTQGIVQAIRNGDWLHVTNLWVFRTQPSLQILFQQRESKSPMYPGLLDCTAAGYLEAGEDPLIGALRELYEELGVELDSAQAFALGRHFNASLDHRGRERRRVITKFAAKWRGELSDLKINPDETPAAYWIDARQFLSLEQAGKIEIKGLSSDGKPIKRQVSKDDFVYNVDDYHFRIIEHMSYLHEKGKL